MSERTPELVVAALAVLLAVGAIALGSRGGASTGRPAAGAAAAATPAHVALVERRVEALRGLRFRHPVPVAIVSPAQARRDGLAEYDRSQPAERQRASEELLKLLGLLPPGTDLRRIEAAIFDQQIAGYYDPRRKRLALVRGAGVDDVTLAHELTHALEDQHVDLQRLEGGGGDDAATAQQALVEGSATLVMERYAARWPSATPLGDALAGLTDATGATPLPAYTMRALVFPYLQGERFVQALRDAGGGSWALVDVAERKRPPTTTAEILDPARWLRAQQPAPVPPAGPLRGWRRLAGSTLGEEDLAALLTPQSGAAAARELTAGWRGGRYALWRRGPLSGRGCATPCRSRDALLLAVRTGSGAQATALAAALGAWVRGELHARPAGHSARGLSRLPGGNAAAIATRGTEVRAALAPSPPLALRLAG
jgi:hypothetical protein